jgi:hypothetical protein
MSAVNVTSESRFILALLIQLFVLYRFMLEIYQYLTVIETEKSFIKVMAVRCDN